MVSCGFVRVVSRRLVGVMMGNVMMVRFDSNEMSKLRGGRSEQAEA